MGISGILKNGQFNKIFLIVLRENELVFPKNLKISGSICDVLRNLNRNFQIEIRGKSRTFLKHDTNVSIGRRDKIQKPLNLSFCSLQLC